MELPAQASALLDSLAANMQLTSGSWFQETRFEVAARAGHSVDVLLKIYAKCIDGQEEEMNDRIMQGLREGDDPTD
ncbi:hypothetical protein ACIRQQ_44590 [Streptomyces fuscichromogenes]|uniref:hypothetical protein n=1 Tax=Streptomyces fuscichromogenes TaxID=1324013 RepID=UPI003805B045